MRWPDELKPLLPLRRTLLAEEILAALLELIVVLLALNAFYNLAAGLNPALEHWRAAGSLAAALPAAALLLARRWPSDLELARRLDRRLDSRERFQTLLELPATDGGAAVRCLKGEVARYLRAHPPARRLELRRLLGRLPLLGLAALFFLATVLAAPALSRQAHARRAQAEARQEALEQLARLQELVAEHERLDGLAAELAELAGRLAESSDPALPELLLREAAELLEQRREELAREREAWRRLAELLEGSDPAEAAALLEEDPFMAGQLLEILEALARVSPPGSTAAEAAEALAGGGLTPEQLAALMRQAGAHEPSGAGELLEEALSALARSLGEAGSANENGAGGNAESGGTGAGEGFGGETGEGSGGNGEGSGGNGEGPGGNGEGPGGKDGEGSGAGAGVNGSGANGSGSNGSSGQGAGTGSGSDTAHHFYFIPAEKELLLEGTAEAGGHTLRELLRYTPASVSGAEYGDYYRLYYRQGITAVRRGDIPAPLKGYVRDYFTAIAPPD